MFTLIANKKAMKYGLDFCHIYPHLKETAFCKANCYNLLTGAFASESHQTMIESLQLR